VEITISDAPERERFEARNDDGDLAGFVTYQLTGNIIAYTHTEVLPEFKGGGVGSRIAKAVMDDARARGRTVVPICPFLVKWLEKNQEYDDIVARDHKKVK
jgi:predicted GNAT family acetyltransferase